MTSTNSRVRLHRIAALMLLALLAAGAPCPAQSTTSLQWKCSTQAAPWIDKPAVGLSGTVPLPASSSVFRIFINSTQTAQVIDGWGGCFNERGWKAVQVLSGTARDTVMKALFDPQTGLKLTIGRTPIGSNDYSIAPYSYDETSGDYSMSHFSIAQDQTYLIPYIKAAQAIQPNLYMWAVPWTPPSWMKSNGSLINGGNILDDNQTLDALALYFLRYLQAYQAQRINISMVMPQNEPNISNNYPTCNWTGVQFSNFIGYHLGPVLANAGLNTKIFLGTYNESSRGGYSYWVAPSVQDAQTSPYIAGVGCQWSADITMNETHIVLPNMKLMQTEAECGSTNSNDWAFGEYQYQLAKKWFAAGASSNIIWNLVLDQTGLSNGGWAQCSPIVVSSTTGQVTYTPYYYCYKHFSYFVQPGAHVATTYSTWGDKIAFANPDGSAVAVIGNSASTSYDVTLNFNGKQSAVITLPAHSFSTFTMPAPLSAVEQWRLQYFGASANSGSAADSADPDGDGMTNAQEYVSGTIPTDKNSYLRVTQIQPGSQGVQITFTTASGKTYRVDYTDSLQPISWMLLQGNIQGTGSTVRVTDPAAASQAQRFYRVVVTS